MKFSFGGLVLIVFGALVLARNLGFLNISIAELIGTWWPLGLIVLGMLRWRLPDDVPRFAARGAIASYPLSAGPSEPTAEEENDLDPAEQEPLHWRDRRVRPWLLAGFFGGQAQAITRSRNCVAENDFQPPSAL